MTKYIKGPIPKKIGRPHFRVIAARYKMSTMIVRKPGVYSRFSSQRPSNKTPGYISRLIIKANPIPFLIFLLLTWAFDGVGAKSRR